MIIIKKSLNSLWAICRVCYKTNVTNSFMVKKMRLFTTEVDILPKETIRSLRNKKGKKSLDPIAWFMLVIPISAFGLGTWQIKRKMWKEGLIKELKKRTDLQPLPLPENLEELKEMEYYPIRVKGKFDHSKEIYMGPRTLIHKNKGYTNTSSLLSADLSGYLVVTPFTLSDRNITILINRGWVPSAKKSPSTRPMGQVSDEIELVGLVRNSEARQPLGMKNIPNKGLWLYRDLEKMSEETGAAPVLIDALACCTVHDGPIGGQTIIGLRDEHFTYIITWYTLAAITAYMWYAQFLI